MSATHRFDVRTRRWPIVIVGLLFASTALAGPDSEKLESVVVTAQRIEDGLEAQQALTPGGVTIIDGADFYRRTVNSLADALRYVPGVWSESTSGTDTMFFSSRGSNLDATDYDMNGIKLLQDGLPVTTADGNNHNRVLDPLSGRYATIARGANALTYGASTLGGAIDFNSPTVRNSAPLQLFVDGGSHGSGGARISAGAIAGAFDGLVTFEQKHWDGYRDHNDQDRSTVYVNAGWQLADAVATRLYATYDNNDEELPGALTKAQVDADADQASPAALAGNFQKNVETWRVASKTVWDIDDHSSFAFGISRESQSLYHPIVEPILVDFDGPGGNPPIEVFSLLVDTDHHDTGAMARYQVQFGVHDLLAGVNYGNSTVDGGNYRNAEGHRNGLSETVDNDADSVEAFVIDRWHFAADWTLIYGAQAVATSRDVRTIDAASFSIRNPDHNYSAVNPRLGVIYELSDNNEVFASVSRLFEAPTNFELTDDVRGNDAVLDAMHGTVYEVGSRGESALARANRWHWEVSLYYAQIHDEILSNDNPVEPGTSLSTNVDETIHAGAEALLGASFAIDGEHRLEPLISVTLNEFSFDDDTVYGNNTLPAAPDYAVRGEVLYRAPSGFYAGPTFDFVGRRYADFTNTYRVDSYTLVGLRSGFTRENWEVFAELRNLLDEDYVATLTVKDQASADAAILYPGAPRSVYAGVRVQL